MWLFCVRCVKLLFALSAFVDIVVIEQDAAVAARGRTEFILRYKQCRTQSKFAPECYKLLNN